MQFLVSKMVFILSPVKWGKMKVSKHHYAIELALAGNRVYYFEPPDLAVRGGIHIKELDEYPNIFLISYRPIARGKRFLPQFIYYILLKYQISCLIQKINIKPDLILCFEPNRFENLKWFKALKTIFFAADLYSEATIPKEVITADLCLGVSPTIVSLLKKNNANVHFINHGLNIVFSELAKKKLGQQLKRINTTEKPVISVGYFGNLLIGALDRKTISEVITKNPSVQFIFWGQYEKGQDNVMAFDGKEVWDFIKFLQQCKNVTLAGPKTQKEIIEEIEQIDLFWLCYDSKFNFQVDGSNSHKILEYLATGKPVIANHTLTYKGTGLIYMCEDETNENYAAYFSRILEMVRSGEPEDLIVRRLNFALQNTYKTQLELIDSFLRYPSPLANA